MRHGLCMCAIQRVNSQDKRLNLYGFGVPKPGRLLLTCVNVTRMTLYTTANLTGHRLVLYGQKAYILVNISAVSNSI